LTLVDQLKHHENGISLFPQCSTTEEEEEEQAQEEACGNKHTPSWGLGEFGCEYEEALSLRKVMKITPFFRTFFEKSNENNTLFSHFL
jgi:hypothetical protein